MIPRVEIEQRNEATAADLLRTVPGLTLSQSGGRGGTTSLFIRGGESKYNLILIDGVPINMFSQGGFVDLAHIPTDFLDRIEVSRGPQSAVYGSYANSGVVNFVSRLDEGAPQMSVIAEGGSHAMRRFAVGASGAKGGYRASVSASRLDTNGEVDNDDYRDENVSLNVGKRFRNQDLSFRGALALERKRRARPLRIESGGQLFRPGPCQPEQEQQLRLRGPLRSRFLKPRAPGTVWDLFPGQQLLHLQLRNQLQQGYPRNRRRPHHRQCLRPLHARLRSRLLARGSEELLHHRRELSGHFCSGAIRPGSTSRIASDSASGSI